MKFRHPERKSKSSTRKESGCSQIYQQQHLDTEDSGGLSAVLKGQKCDPEILYPAKINIPSLKNKGSREIPTNIKKFIGKKSTWKWNSAN